MAAYWYLRIGLWLALSIPWFILRWLCRPVIGLHNNWWQRKSGLLMLLVALPLFFCFLCCGVQVVGLLLLLESICWRAEWQEIVSSISKVSRFPGGPRRA